mgnify:CR=1 FL=1
MFIINYNTGFLEMKKREYLKVVGMFLSLTVGVSLAVSAIVSILIGLLFVGWHYLS